MQVRLIDAIKVEFKDSRVKEKCQHNSLEQLNREQRGRALDGFKLCDAETLKKLKAEYADILKDIAAIGLNEPELIKIKDIPFFEFSSGKYRFVEWEVFFKEIPKRDLIQNKFVQFIKKIIALGCKEIFDGTGKINPELIAVLGWNVFKRVNVKIDPVDILSAFYHNIIADVMFDSKKNPLTTTALTGLVDIASSHWLTQEAEPYVVEAYRHSQRLDYYGEIAIDFVVKLSTFKTSLPAYIPVLKKMIEDDLGAGTWNVEIRRKKITFWINVMYECGPVYEQYNLFNNMMDAFLKNLPIAAGCPDIKNFDVVKDMPILDDADKKRYLDCREWQVMIKKTGKSDPVLSVVQSDNQGELCFKQALVQKLDKRDKAIIYDEVLKDYLATDNIQRLIGEDQVLRQFMDRCLSNTSRNAVNLLQLGLVECKKNKIYGGALAKIFERYMGYFPVLDNSNVKLFSGGLKRVDPSSKVSTTMLNHKRM